LFALEVAGDVDFERERVAVDVERQVAPEQAAAGLAVFVREVQVRGSLAQRMLHG
jgi:hypothetical protein